MTRALATVGRLLRAMAAFAVLAALRRRGAVAVDRLVRLAAELARLAPACAQLPGLAEMTGAVTNPWSDQMILAMLASIGWVLWLIFLRHVIVEIIEASADAAAARRGQLRAPGGGRGPIRWVAAVLVGAIIGAVLFDAARAVTSSGTSATAAADAAARRPAVAVAAPAPARRAGGGYRAPRGHHRPPPPRQCRGWSPPPRHPPHAGVGARRPRRDPPRQGGRQPVGHRRATISATRTAGARSTPLTEAMSRPTATP